MKKIILILLLCVCFGCSKNTEKRCYASSSDSSDIKIEVVFSSKDNIVYSLEKNTIVNLMNYDQETIEAMKNSINSDNYHKTYGVTTSWDFTENQVIKKDIVDLEKATITSLVEIKIIPFYDQDDLIIYHDTLVELFKNQYFQILEESN